MLFRSRLAAVCIELTKKFEEIRRGFLSDLADKFATKQPKGEVTIVVSGNNPKFTRDDASGDVSEDPKEETVMNEASRQDEET